MSPARSLKALRLCHKDRKQLAMAAKKHADVSQILPNLDAPKDDTAQS